MAVLPEIACGLWKLNKLMFNVLRGRKQNEREILNFQMPQNVPKQLDITSF